MVTRLCRPPLAKAAQPTASAQSPHPFPKISITHAGLHIPTHRTALPLRHWPLAITNYRSLSSLQPLLQGPHTPLCHAKGTPYQTPRLRQMIHSLISRDPHMGLDPPKAQPSSSRGPFPDKSMTALKSADLACPHATAFMTDAIAALESNNTTNGATASESKPRRMPVISPSHTVATSPTSSHLSPP